jgi:molecular chaperone DnaK
MIGCAEYEDEDIHDLKYSDHDAQTVAATIASASGVTASDLFLLSSKAPGKHRSTRSNILRVLSQPSRLSQVPDIELLFFFFSGHGCRSQKAAEDYLLPCDTVFDSLEETALKFDTVIRYLRMWNAHQTILFVDACRATFRAGKSIELATHESLQSDLLKFPGIATFWACRPGERSYEVDAEESGLFSFALNKALGEEGRCKSIVELDRWLASAVPEACNQYGLRSQTPWCYVEPLARQHTIIVAKSVLDRWESANPTGTEIRAKVAPALKLDRYPASLYCGFDFGTSYSVVAVCDLDGNPAFIPSPQNRMLVPSVVAFTPNFDYLVGWPAVEYAHVNRDAAVFNVKRLLGSGEYVTVHDRPFSPELIASLIIRSLARNVEEYLKTPIYRALVSAPANFSMRQCNALAKAFEIAGVPVIRFVSEPSAAGLAAEFTSSPLQKYAHMVILDLGGGTLDVGLVEIGEEIWEMRSVAGDRELGGLDYDSAVQRYVESKIRDHVRIPGYEFNQLDLAQLRFEAERVKIELGTTNESRVLIRNFECDGGFYDIDIPISRGLFSALVEGLNDRVSASINLALNNAGLWGDRVDRIFLAGQGAKIFCVRELIKQRFPGVPLEDAHQENAVAFGIGRYSGVLNGIVKDRLLLEAIPFSLGIRCSRIVPLEEELTGHALFTVSVDPAMNTEKRMLLRPNTTIPTRKVDFGKIDGKAGAIVNLQIIETDIMQRTDTDIGMIEIRLGNGRPEFECVIDVDANRTVAIKIDNFSTGETLYYQANNFFTESIGFGGSEPASKLGPQ